MTSKDDRGKTGKANRGDTLIVKKRENETDSAASARVVHDPAVRAAAVGRKFVAPFLGEMNVMDSYAALDQQAVKVNSGDLSGVERRLIAQADTLDSIFNDMARRAALNSSQYLPAMEIYMRLALKAQSQCRATLETLANIKNPTLVIARQANIAAGPQQINNGTGPARAHAGKNHEVNDQSHAPETARPVSAPSGATLLGHEQALPMPMQGPGSEGGVCVPDARRAGGRADGGA